MSRIVVCMDCPNYAKGGFCNHKRKDTGALSPACDYALTLNDKFNPEDNDEPMGNLAPQAKTKTCTKCGRELPISEFYAKAGSKDGLQTICKECHNEATKKSREKKEAKDGLKPPTKLCKRCGRELPLIRFGKNAGTKDGLQYWCKECQNRTVTEAKAKKRAAEDSFLGKSESEPKPETEQRRPGEPGGLEPMERPIPGSEFMILPKAGPQPRQDPRLENFESKELANKLRARGYMVKAQRPIKVIEEL